MVRYNAPFKGALMSLQPSGIYPLDFLDNFYHLMSLICARPSGTNQGGANVRHKGPQAHLDHHKLQPYCVAHGSNLFVWSWALGLLRLWAQDPLHYTWPKAHWAYNLELYTSWFTARDLPGQHILSKNVIARCYYILASRYYPGEYRCRTSHLRWEPIPKPLLTLPTKHPFKGNGIGPPCPLIT